MANQEVDQIQPSIGFPHIDPLLLAWQPIGLGIVVPIIPLVDGPIASFTTDGNSQRYRRVDELVHVVQSSRFECRVGGEWILLLVEFSEYRFDVGFALWIGRLRLIERSFRNERAETTVGIGWSQIAMCPVIGNEKRNRDGSRPSTISDQHAPPIDEQ